MKQEFLHLPEILSEGLGISRSEARRLTMQGAVRCDGELVGGFDLDIPADEYRGRTLTVGKSKRTVHIPEGE